MSKISLKNLTWAKTAMLCAILLCAGVAAYLGADVFIQIDLQYRIENIEQMLWQEINSTVYATTKLDDYIIGKVGSYYYAVNGTGHLAYYDTGLVATIQWAHDQLSSGGSIGIKYDDYYTNKEWEAQLNITNSGIHLHGSTFRYGTGLVQFRAKDNLDAPYGMILITGVKNRISQMTMDGNKANQASGNGIYDGSGNSGDTHLDHVVIFNAKETGIIWASGAGTAENVYVEYSSGRGWQITGDNNCFIRCSGAACGNRAFEITGNGNIFTNCIAAYSTGSYGYGFQITGASDCHILSTTVFGNSKSGIVFCSVTNCTVDALVYDNTEYGVWLLTCTTYSTRNVIKGIIHDNGAYGIYENDVNQDYNIVHDSIVTGHSTVDIKLQSSNSYCVDSYNGTSWVSEYSPS